MRTYGFSAPEVRAHSPAWAQAQLESISRRHKLELADQAIVHYQAVAAGMGSYENAGADLQELIEKLRADVDESTAWILNPDAKTDLEALRASGRLTNQERA